MDDVGNPYHRWLMDQEVVQHLAVALTDRSLPALRIYVYDVIRNPNRYFYMIEDKARSMGVGTISANVSTLHSTASYGFMIGEKEYWGTDAAFQAQMALFDFLFHDLELRKLCAGVYLSNIKSHFSIRRLAFVKEGLLRSHVRTGEDGNDVADVVQYGLLADEWRKVRHKFSELRILPHKEY